jgi:PAS domain S-box-containing protein
VPLEPLRDRASGIALIGATPGEHGLILRANERLAQLLGTSVEALTQTKICSYLHPDDQARARAAYVHLLSGTEELHDTQLRLIAAGGAEVAVRAYASPIAMRDGLAIVLRVLAD